MKCYNACPLLAIGAACGIVNASGRNVKRQYENSIASSETLATTTSSTSPSTSTTRSSTPLTYANVSITSIEATTGQSTSTSTFYIVTPDVSATTGTTSSMSTPASYSISDYSESSGITSLSETSGPSVVSVISATGNCNQSSTTTFINSVGADDVSIVDVTRTITAGYKVTMSAGHAYGASYSPLLETIQSPCVTSILSKLVAETITNTNLESGGQTLATYSTAAGSPVFPTMSIPPSITDSSRVDQVLYLTNYVIVTKKTPIPVYPTTSPALSDKNADISRTRTRPPVTPPTYTTVGNDRPHGPNNNENNQIPSNGGQGGPSGSGSNSGSNAGSGQRPDSGAGDNPRINYEPEPTVVTIDREIVTIQTKNVVIGGSSAPIPTDGQNPPRIVVNGNTFTVLPTQVIGPSSRYNIRLNQVPVTTMTQPTSTAVVNGITATIGPSQVIVSGTTYRVGISATEQTVTIEGKVLTINSQGVVFPPTTLTPAITIVVSSRALYELIVVDGITLSISGTEAIISGTTFKIGSGALSSITAVDGHTITVGPPGVVVGTHTITPTNIDQSATLTASTGLALSTNGPEETGGGSETNDTEENSAGSTINGAYIAMRTYFAVFTSLLICFSASHIFG